MRTKTTNRTTIEIIIIKYAGAYFASIIYYDRGHIIAVVCSEIRIKLTREPPLEHAIMINEGVT
jgi:hypothetical protein